MSLLYRLFKVASILSAVIAGSTALLTNPRSSKWTSQTVGQSFKAKMSVKHKYNLSSYFSPLPYRQIHNTASHRSDLYHMKKLQHFPSPVSITVITKRLCSKTTKKIYYKNKLLRIRIFYRILKSLKIVSRYLLYHDNRSKMKKNFRRNLMGSRHDFSPERYRSQTNKHYVSSSVVTPTMMSKFRRNGRIPSSTKHSPRKRQKTDLSSKAAIAKKFALKFSTSSRPRKQKVSTTRPTQAILPLTNTSETADFPHLPFMEDIISKLQLSIEPLVLDIKHHQESSISSTSQTKKQEITIATSEDTAVNSTTQKFNQSSTITESGTTLPTQSSSNTPKMKPTPSTTPHIDTMEIKITDAVSPISGEIQTQTDFELPDYSDTTEIISSFPTIETVQPLGIWEQHNNPTVTLMPMVHTTALFWKFKNGNISKNVLEKLSKTTRVKTTQKGESFLDTQTIEPASLTTPPTDTTEITTIDAVSPISDETPTQTDFELPDYSHTTEMISSSAETDTVQSSGITKTQKITGVETTQKGESFLDTQKPETTLSTTLLANVTKTQSHTDFTKSSETGISFDTTIVSDPPTLKQKCGEGISSNVTFLDFFLYLLLNTTVPMPCSDTARLETMNLFQTILKNKLQQTMQLPKTPHIKLPQYSQHLPTRTQPCTKHQMEPNLTILSPSGTLDIEPSTPGGLETTEVTEQPLLSQEKFLVYTMEHPEGLPFFFSKKSPHIKNSTKTIIIGHMPNDDKKELQNLIHHNLSLLKNVITFDLTTIPGHDTSGVKYSTKTYFKEKLAELYKTYDLTPEQVKLTLFSYEIDNTGELF